MHCLTRSIEEIKAQINKEIIETRKEIGTTRSRLAELEKKLKFSPFRRKEMKDECTVLGQELYAKEIDCQKLETCISEVENLSRQIKESESELIDLRRTIGEKIEAMEKEVDPSVRVPELPILELAKKDSLVKLLEDSSSIRAEFKEDTVSFRKELIALDKRVAAGQRRLQDFPKEMKEGIKQRAKRAVENKFDREAILEAEAMLQNDPSYIQLKKEIQRLENDTGRPVNIKKQQLRSELSSLREALAEKKEEGQKLRFRLTQQVQNDIKRLGQEMKEGELQTVYDKLNDLENKHLTPIEEEMETLQKKNNFDRKRNYFY